MTKIEDRTVTFLKKLPLFAGLPGPDVDALISAAKATDYRKNERLFLQGEPAQRLFVIIQGWVKLFRGTLEGDEAVVALFTRGDVFGEAVIFDDTNYPFSAMAAEDAKLLEIPGSLLKLRARENPEITKRIMASMSREMHKLQMEHEHMALMNAPQRVGCLLLQLAAGMIGKGGTFSFPYDKSLAAQRLGMKPETFSRALAQLKPVGVKVHGSEIDIDDFQRLIDYTCGNCTAYPDQCDGARQESCPEREQCHAKSKPEK
jgi:CRP/FNR family transcriptional regulator, dissimilatory nitrate respiration regulator